MIVKKTLNAIGTVNKRYALKNVIRVKQRDTCTGTTYFSKKDSLGNYLRIECVKEGKKCRRKIICDSFFRKKFVWNSTPYVNGN